MHCPIEAVAAIAAIAMKTIDIDALQSRSGFDLFVMIPFLDAGKDESVFLGALLLNSGFLQ
jgi:hypothetical protein